jgi:hypothetical protein
LCRIALLAVAPKAEFEAVSNALLGLPEKAEICVVEVKRTNDPGRMNLNSAKRIQEMKSIESRWQHL